MLGYLGLFLQFNLPFHVFIRNFHHMFESVLRCVWGVQTFGYALLVI